MDRYTEDKKNEKRKKKNTCITELRCLHYFCLELNEKIIMTVYVIISQEDNNIICANMVVIDNLSLFLVYSYAPNIFNVLSPE
jgi:hypothetical protein